MLTSLPGGIKKPESGALDLGLVAGPATKRLMRARGRVDRRGRVGPAIVDVEDCEGYIEVLETDWKDERPTHDFIPNLTGYRGKYLVIFQSCDKISWNSTDFFSYWKMMG